MKDLSTDELAELRAELRHLRQQRRRLDHRRGIRSLLHALDQDLSEDECLLAFEMTDADGDGSISFEEFMGWWTE